MPVMTRRQTAKLAENLAKSIEDENNRQKKFANEELVGVLRDRWSDCQKSSMIALDKIHRLENDIKSLKTSREHFMKQNKINARNYLNAQDKIIQQGSEILEWTYSYETLENKYNDLYEKYQEIRISAGLEIDGLQKTCENQAEVIDKLETNLSVFGKIDERFETQRELTSLVAKILKEYIGPIQELIYSTKIDAISNMRKALLNVIGVQYKTFNSFTEHELNLTFDKIKKQVLDVKEPPHEFMCPISGTIMEDPVITSNGEIYDRKSIESWKNELPENKKNVANYEHYNEPGGNMESPLSRSWISGKFYPLVGLKTQIIEWGQKEDHNNKALLGIALHNFKYASQEAKKLLAEESGLYVFTEMRNAILDNMRGNE